MLARGLDPVDEVAGVEGLLHEVEPPGVELVGQEDLVDDAVEALGLVDDQGDEAVAARLVEREVVAQRWAAP